MKAAISRNTFWVQQCVCNGVISPDMHYYTKLTGCVSHSEHTFSCITTRKSRLIGMFSLESQTSFNMVTLTFIHCSRRV